MNTYVSLQYEYLCEPIIEPIELIWSHYNVYECVLL